MELRAHISGRAEALIANQTDEIARFVAPMVTLARLW